MNEVEAYNFSMGASAILTMAASNVLFSELPLKVREKFFVSKKAYNALESLLLKNKSLSTAARELAPKFGMTPRNLERLFKRVQDSNCHWTAFLDKRYVSKFWNGRAGEDTEKLPKPFIEYWQKLCMENQRCNRQAWAKLLRNLDAWRSGTGGAIAGYDEPPLNYGIFNFPKGWSYCNLNRYSPNVFETAAVRLGRTAAMQVLPSVRTSRAGTYFFAEVNFDDMWHDFFINNFGNNPSACRLLEFGAIDIHSGYILPPLLKPRLLGMADGKLKNLNERDFRFFIAYLVTQVGFNPRGTVFLVERGTAAIRPELERILFELSGGAITVRRGGISGQGAFIGAYEGRGKGNPRAKASKEGIGKLLHNKLATLPGQVGTGVDARPEEIHGRLKENAALIKAYSNLPEAKRKELEFGILSYEQASELIFKYYGEVNSRTAHDLEGWEELGYCVTEVRIPGGSEWVKLEDVLKNMNAREAEIFRAMAAANSEMTRKRKLSPQEVYCIAPFGLTDNAKRLRKDRIF